jgi:hypothetical protein
MKTSMILLGALVLELCAVPQIARAQTPGGYDNSFSEPVANGPVFAVGTTQAGYIWMGGYFNSVNSSYHASEDFVSVNDTYFDLAVLNTNGGLTTAITFPSYASSLSTDMNPGGGLYYYYVGALAIDSNDVVFAAFNAQRGNNTVIARFDPSGPGSWTFNSSYTANAVNKFNVIYGLAADGSTTYVAGGGTLGELDYGGNNTGYHLPPGILPYYNSFVYQVRYLPMSAGFTNNSLLICGGFGVARISTTGTSIYQQNVSTSGQPTCAATRTDAAQAACPDPEGELIAGGESSPFTAEFYEDPSTVDGFFLYRYGTNSTNDLFSSIGGLPFSIARIEALPAGDMIVCGDFTEINGVSTVGLAHLQPGGAVDTAFYNHSAEEPFDMAIQPDGKIVLGGSSEYTDYQIFGAEYGYVERHYGVPAGSGPSIVITGQPYPTNQTVYVGDYVSYSVDVSSSVGFDGQWMHNGTNLIGDTGTSFSFEPSSTNDSGVYQFMAQTIGLCPAIAVSSNVTLTVLPPPPPPPNDDFDDAYVLTGTNVITNGYVRSSTLEPGEPDPTGSDDGCSVWYAWTAPANLSVTIDVSGSDFYPVALAVYTGTAVDALTPVTNNCDEVSDGEGGYYCNGLFGSVTFQAVAGTTYEIGIGGAPATGSLGDILLILSASVYVPPPPVVTSWRTVYTNSDLVFYTVATGGGKLVAGGYSDSQGTDLLATSCNPSNWSIQNPGLYDIEEVTHAGDYFLIGGLGVIVESTNATTWTSNNLTGLNLSNLYIEGSTYAKSHYVNTAANGVVITSPDALAWTLEATNSTYEDGDWLYNATYGNGVFVAVGDEGSVVTSPDGTNWTLSASQIGNYSYDSLTSVAFGNGLFVAVGDDSTVVTSYDGTNWTLQAYPFDSLYNVAYGDGLFVAVGSSSDFSISPDGTNWVSDLSGTSASLYGVSYYQNGQFVAVGDNGTILVNQLPTFQPAVSTNGGVVMTLVGLSGSTAVIESTPKLSPANWRPIYTNTILNGSIAYTNNPSCPTEFYRAVVR